MKLQDTLEQKLVADYAKEAEEVAKRLENGSGTVATCPAHKDIASGVKLCLRLLLCVLADVQSPKKVAIWNSAAMAGVLVLYEIVKLILKMHGVDTTGIDVVKNGITGN